MPPPAPLDQDDLDDLDDVLDQFSRQPDSSATSEFPTSPLTSPPPPPPSATTTTFGRQRTNTRVDAPPVPAGRGLAGVAEAEEDAGAMAGDFAAELARGMESLMREIAGEAAASGAGSSGGAADDAALKAAWESMLIENMDGMAADKDKDNDNKGDEPAGDFQAKIRQAIGKLREGEAALDDASGADAGAAPDSLEALLAQLGAAGEGDLPADEAELAGFLENMMGELMSKDVLYEPLKELADKLPPYLAHPPASLTPDDRARYEAQLERVRAILAVFDAPTFSDTDPKTRESIVALMAEMQSFGSPPSELMGPLPPGLGALGEDGCLVS
ncbi:Pex19 protein family-domain-containing protein [Mycena pura]|uniref:Pex19 protein family-domain-containing protein n=1 Tax=Mycena pura TaxID=153505 RepID=A0AAD6YLD5_9AGAR|nr:Pex19 protein family-domain-containing protein [Mycena pura]